MIGCVVGHHMNTHRSGVARFNALLARELGVPVLSLADDWSSHELPLLSFKADELSPEEEREFRARLDSLDGTARIRAFLHVFDGSDTELAMVERCEVVYCGNEAVLAAVEPLAARAELLWSPSTLSDLRRFAPAEVTVFSFGMAHKMRVDEYRRLRELLERDGRSYAIYLSNANHESATMRDGEVVFERMREVFPEGLYFLGNLSDVAVHNHLLSATFFAAFFKNGARANNSTIVTAMEHGSVVVTNLDEHSPAWLRHMDNVIDVNRAESLPHDPLVLRRIGLRAMETAEGLGWDAFVRRIAAPGR